MSRKKIYHLTLYFAKIFMLHFVVIHLNAMGLRPLTEGQKCVWSLWEDNFPVCPQLASETGTAGSAVTLRSHSPHHTWNDMAALTLHSSVWL